MKKLAIVLLLALCACCIFAACDFLPVTYKVTSEKSSYTVTVGQQIDYKSYFTITSSENEQIVVTDQMIDASKADTSKPGAFIVTCSYKGGSCTIIFVVEAANQGHTHEFGSATCTLPATCSCGATQGAALGHTTTSGTCTRCGETIGNQGSTTANLSDVFANYDDYAEWNFEIVFGVVPSDTQNFEGWTYIYAYDGLDCCLTDQDGTFVDYVVLGESNATYYYDNVDGTYTVYQFDYETLYTEYVDYIELSTLADFTFVANGDHYSASNPSDAGDEIFGGYVDCTYTSLDLYVASGKLAKIVAVMHDSENNCDWTFTVEFTKHGNIIIDVSDLVIDGETGGESGDTPNPPSGDTVDLSDIFALYTDYESWNFEMVFDVDASDSSVAEEYAYTSVYLYDGYNFCYTDALGSYVDYVIYTNDDILYYYQNDDGSYSKYSYNNNYDDFSDYYNYIDWADLAQLGNYQFVANGNYYSAVSPSQAGNAIIGEYTNCTYTTFDLYVSNGKISKIVAYQQDNDLKCIFTYTIELSKYGTITVDVSDIDPDNGSSGGGDVGGDDDDVGGTTTPSQQEIVVEFATSTGSTTLNSTGEVYFTASRAVDNWEADRGLQFEKQKGTVTLTSTTTVNNVATIVLDVSANKTTDVTITVKVGNTVFTCNGQSSATFQNIKHNILTFTTSTPVSGVIQITAVPAKTNASGLGSVYFSSVTISATGAGGSGGSGNTPSNTMPEQTFNPNNHVDHDDILYDAITKNDEAAGYLPSTALPSQGTYDVLVIPVEFSNDTFTTKELNDLNDAFNNKANTGWESVSSYYNTASYGKLNLTFDIVGKVSLSQTYQNFDGGSDYGADILKLALDILEARGFDFTKYDYDNNGVIDGVYIIYSAPIDYDQGDYYWAYVTATDDETLYDDLYAYTYLFASVDFMYEDIETSNPAEFSPIDGLTINAVTYIHETGHMLGLDDYYDYNPNQGSDEGLGGSDMMDYTVGDHNAYSKLLLGWVKPTAVVTTTQTITISNFESSGQFIVVLLDYDGTYFSEYLIIDLYSATGLNALHAGVDGSYLYDGASFGARIYHVDATINNPYSDDYYSFTDNNNSISKDPLIKLVEADGDKNFESDQYQGYGFAAEDDLWQTGDVFSQIQPNYTRNDGKVVNFDITFVSVSATSATITITFNTPQ